MAQRRIWVPWALSWNANSMPMPQRPPRCSGQCLVFSKSPVVSSNCRRPGSGVCFTWIRSLSLIFLFAFSSCTRLGSSHWQPRAGLLCGPREPHDHLAASHISSHPRRDAEIWVHPADGATQQAVGDQRAGSPYKAVKGEGQLKKPPFILSCSDCMRKLQSH